jgi:hypothetical protein
MHKIPELWTFIWSFCTWQNVVFLFGHCVVCSSSIYGFWLPLWYLQTLLWTVTTFCQVQKDQINVHNSGILCINWWLYFLHFRILLTDDCVVCIYRVKSNIDFPNDFTIIFWKNMVLVDDIGIFFLHFQILLTDDCLCI